MNSNNQKEEQNKTELEQQQQGASIMLISQFNDPIS